MMHGGWGHGPGGGGGGMRPIGLRGALDQDIDEALGSVYDHQVVSRLARYVLPFRKLVFLAMLCTLVYSVSSSATPRLIGLAIDRFISAGDLPGLTAITAIYLGNGLLSWATQYGQTITLAWVGQSVLHSLRISIFDHLQKLSLSFFDA